MTTRLGSSLPVARLLMVVGSLAPLFILWAIRGGQGVVPDRYWLPFCALWAIAPNLILFGRWKVASRNNDHRHIIIRASRDQSEHLLVYLFAMLIPLFGVDLSGAREITAVFAAVLFVVFIFWHMNLHYLNILFAILGYRVFTVEAATSVGSTTDVPGRPIIVLSKRTNMPRGAEFDAIRLSNTVFFEKD